MGTQWSLWSSFDMVLNGCREEAVNRTFVKFKFDSTFEGMLQSRRKQTRGGGGGGQE